MPRADDISVVHLIVSRQDICKFCGPFDLSIKAYRGLMPEGAESYAKPFSATCIRQ